MSRKKPKPSKALPLSEPLTFALPEELLQFLTANLNRRVRRALQERWFVHEDSVVTLGYSPERRQFAVYVARKEGDPPYHVEWWNIALSYVTETPHEKYLAQPRSRVKPAPEGSCGCCGDPVHGDDPCTRCWLCPGCKQLRPYEYGAADDNGELCDSCWNLQVHTTCPRCQQHTFRIKEDAGKPHCGDCENRIWRESLRAPTT